jgi:stage II sporulation protein D
MRRAGVLVVLSALAACAAPRAGTPSAAPLPESLRVGVIVGSRTEVLRLPIEQYVTATILSEFAPAAGDPVAIEQMLEVQAVISRTYAAAHLSRHAKDGYDVCATTHCQLFQPSRLRTSRWAVAAAEAVRRTAGIAVWYDGLPAETLFHADCGGHTSSAADVWGGRSVPYLAGVEDDGAASRAHAAWTYETTTDALQRALDSDSRTRIDRLESIEVIQRDSGGRAERVRLRGQTDRVVRGEDLRDVLTRAFGARTIRSMMLDVRSRRGAMVFEGRGFGHGVGLCQAGAFARINAGEKPIAVLARYYPGTRVLDSSPVARRFSGVSERMIEPTGQPKILTRH